MPRQVSLLSLREKVKNLISDLEADLAGEARIKPLDLCEFLYITGDEEELEIPFSEFIDNPKPAPGKYRFKLWTAEPEPKLEKVIDAIHYEVNESEQRDAGTNPLREMTLAAQRLTNLSASETERMARRLRDEENKTDKLKLEIDGYKMSITKLHGDIAGLELELDKALEGGDDTERFANVLGSIIMRVMGLDGDGGNDTDADKAKALEDLLEVIRKSQEVQLALSNAGAGKSMLLLGMGNKNEGGEDSPKE